MQSLFKNDKDLNSEYLNNQKNDSERVRMHHWDNIRKLKSKGYSLIILIIDNKIYK